MKTKHLKSILFGVIVMAFLGLCADNGEISLTALALTKLACIGVILLSGYGIARLERKETDH